MIAHKFIIILKTIKLDVPWPVQLIIKYNNGILSHKTFSTEEPIQIKPKDDQEHWIPGYDEYEVKMNQIDLGIALDTNPLKIKFYNNKTQFGKATAELSKLLTPDAEDMRYGKRYRQDVPIFGLNNDEELMGTINCIFVLKQEECITCKSCNVPFKPSTILKHVKGNKDCKGIYGKEGLEYLEEQSAVRKREMRNIRNWIKYDPSKRAELHSKYYNPTIRAERHKKNKEADREKQSKELKTMKETALKTSKESMEKDATESNFLQFKRKKIYIQKAKTSMFWDQKSCSQEIEDKLEAFELKMFELQSKLDKKIEKTSAFINDSNLTSLFEIKNIWGKMKEKILRDWQKFGKSMEEDFFDFAKQSGLSEETVQSKFSSFQSYL